MGSRIAYGARHFELVRFDLLLRFARTITDPSNVENERERRRINEKMNQKGKSAFHNPFVDEVAPQAVHGVLVVQVELRLRPRSARRAEPYRADPETHETL